jgi:hypothetical protein
VEVSLEDGVDGNARHLLMLDWHFGLFPFSFGFKGQGPDGSGHWCPASARILRPELSGATGPASALASPHLLGVVPSPRANGRPPRGRRRAPRAIWSIGSFILTSWSGCEGLEACWLQLGHAIDAPDLWLLPGFPVCGIPWSARPHLRGTIPGGVFCSFCGACCSTRTVFLALGCLGPLLAGISAGFRGLARCGAGLHPVIRRATGALPVVLWQGCSDVNLFSVVI